MVGRSIAWAWHWSYLQRASLAAFSKTGEKPLRANHWSDACWNAGTALTFALENAFCGAGGAALYG